MALGLLTAGPATAFTAGELQARCQLSDPYRRGVCDGFIRGVLETLTSAEAAGRKRVCLPYRPTLQFVIDLTLAYVKSHPEQANSPAAEMVAAALTERFPCPD